MFGLTKREQQQAAWEREAALIVPAIVEIAKAAMQADALDCRTCYNMRRNETCDAFKPCTDGDKYEPLPPVRLWRKSE